MRNTKHEVIMPLHVRSIAVSIAVICFFILSLVGWVSGLSPFVCCKRAMIGAMLAYVAGSWAVKAINTILVNAMITNQMNQQEDSNFATDHKVGYGEKGSGGTD
ncbi:MAG: hypothetical protein ACYSYV_08360 [Planctomycetota bacterium]|jgi:hypothetical protein